MLIVYLSRAFACVVALLVVLPSQSNHVSASESSPTMANLVQQSPYDHAWRLMLTGELDVPHWLDRDEATSSPVTHRIIDGQTYLVGSMCQTHDCADHQFWGMLDEHGRAAWGLLVTRRPDAPHLPGATDFPNFQLRWFGRPGRQMQRALISIWQAGPIWPACAMHCAYSPLPPEHAAPPDVRRAASRKVRFDLDQCGQDAVPVALPVRRVLAFVATRSTAAQSVSLDRAMPATL